MIAAWIAQGVVALVDVHVLPIDPPGALMERAVVVRDGVVERIEPARGFVAPDGARVVDGRGRWLLPGLIDADARFEDTGELALHLAHGVTTVRVQPGRTAVLDVRRAIASGELLGPTLVVGSPRIDRGDASRMREITARIDDAGYDFVSLGRRLSAQAALEIVACAHERALPVAGELPRSLGRTHGLEGRATLEGVEFLMDPPLPPKDDGRPQIERPVTIERGMGRAFPRDELASICRAVAESRVSIVPQIAAFEGLIPQIEHRAVMLEDRRLERISPPFRMLWGFHGHGLRRFFPTTSVEPATECLAFQRELLVALRDAGATLVAGSAAMRDFLWPGEALVLELEAWCAAGLSAGEALRGATGGAARALGLEGGVVRVGARADLVLVERDPRVDVGRLREVVGVVVRGRWTSAAQIELERARRARTYAREAIDLEALVEKDIRPALAGLLAREDGVLARPEAALRLGELFVDVDRAKDAEYFARACLERHPDAWWPHWVLARALRRLKENDAAAEAARAALAKRPDAIEPWLLLEELGHHSGVSTHAHATSTR